MPEVAAIDRLLRVHPGEVANFALSAEVIRSSALTIGETLMLLPERGALPMYWAADGIPDVERSIEHGATIRLPIGSFDYRAENGSIQKGTLNPNQKRLVVSRHRELIREAGHVTIMDEVQKGGTIVELVSIINGLRNGQQRQPSLYVIAAQDSRRKVAAENKKPEYIRMATGGFNWISTSVIPLPLFATDRDALLNKLWYAGKTRIPTEQDPDIQIIPNEEAEIIFRVLGTVARHRDTLEDTTLLDDAVFAQPMNEQSAKRVEEWRHMFLRQLRRRVR